MRAFIVMCLVAVASADKLGYNYQPVGHSANGLSFSPGSGGQVDGGSIGGAGFGGGSIGGGSSFGGGSIGGGSSFGGGSLGGLGGGSIGGGSLGGLGGGSIGGGSLGGLGGGSIGGGSLGGLGGGSIGGGSLGGLGGGSIGGGNLGGGFGGIGGDNGAGFGGIDSGSVAGPTSYNAPAPAAELEKEFFTFSANEDEFDQPETLERVQGSVNKGLRVVFIKGPENRGLEHAALALAKQAAQQETAIYVLNKQADIGDLASKLNTIRNNNNNKPEVHFVKYRTPEDAANAQRAIQGQYDQLGGKTQTHDGGVAHSLNFASQAPVRQANAQQPDNSYLPTSVFRRF